MGTWLVPADVLASSGFGISPKAEVVAALGALIQPRSPEQRAFSAAHRAAFAQWLTDHPIAGDLVRASFRQSSFGVPGWIADYLVDPAEIPEPTFEHEIALIGELTDDDIRGDLSETTGAPLAPRLLAPGLREVAVEVVRWLWTHTLETDWPRRERILRADIVARTAQLAWHGWAAVLRDLGRDREWDGDGHRRINRYDLPSRTLSPQARLMFVPTHDDGSWVGWRGARYALYYPVAGRLASVGVAGARGLEALLGSNRATVLVLLDVPRSTSQIGALSGLALASVSGHLRILLESGVVTRRRSGREVLYWRTALGDTLVASGSERPPDAGRPARATQ